MCVIIEKPKGITLDWWDIDAAFQNNSDGFGYMYADPTSQRVVCRKFLKKGWNAPDKIHESFERLKDKYVIYHFRMATHGRIDKEMSHPFQILDKDRHGVDLYFCHNGVLSQHGNVHHDNVSDTVEFMREILRPILRENPELLFTSAVQKLLSDYIGGDKLAFLFGDGRSVFINKRLGDEFKGCWVSNTYSFQAFTSRYNWGGANYDSKWGRGDYNYKGNTKKKEGNPNVLEDGAPFYASEDKFTKDTAPKHIVLSEEEAVDKIIKAEDEGKSTIITPNDFEWTAYHLGQLTFSELTNFVWDFPDETVEILSDLLYDMGYADNKAKVR